MKTEKEILVEDFEEIMLGVEPYREEDPTIIKLEALQERIVLRREVIKYKMLLYSAIVWTILFVAAVLN